MALTCDGASTNRRLWKIHNQEELTYKVPNIFAADGPRSLSVLHFRSTIFSKDSQELLVEHKEKSLGKDICPGVCYYSYCIFLMVLLLYSSLFAAQREVHFVEAPGAVVQT